ncbi:hypothetical protein CPB86DRAFT_778651 [Serendipita vermifera]|nr:hypothetical protein CPB86DRAFT_778651 [Serendipita vermifera]
MSGGGVRCALVRAGPGKWGTVTEKGIQLKATIPVRINSRRSFRGSPTLILDWPAPLFSLDAARIHIPRLSPRSRGQDQIAVYTLIEVEGPQLLLFFCGRLKYNGIPHLQSPATLQSAPAKVPIECTFHFKTEGPQHAQKWRCFCYIRNTFVGCSDWCTNKDAAKEEAAGHAVEWLDKFGYH